MNTDSYCRELEAYLCRKNDGHLVRIVGPAFERVSEWARQGIPAKVACQGIDRYFERYYRRGPRRRPVRIEFCEADVLDAFDAWRRAVGVAHDSEGSQRPRSSLSSHIERVIASLTALRASVKRTRAIDDTLDAIVRELDSLLPHARGARGEARDRILSQLAAFDRRLIDAAMTAMSDDARAHAKSVAREQLASFRERMTTEGYDRACEAAVQRLVREELALPAVAFE